jgi:hypothetical protein
MLNWMYWPHGAEETGSVTRERREPSIGARAPDLEITQEVPELALAEEEVSTDPYNRVGHLTRPKRIRML